MASRSPGNFKSWKSRLTGMRRRTFIKITALAGIAAAASRLFSHPALGSIVHSPELPEGEGVITEKWMPTSCLNCATRCATRVRVVNGRAVKVTGNPLSRVSEGENCPRAHVGLQVLYDPARITAPLKRTNSAMGRGTDPGWVQISWEQAFNEIAGKLKALRENGTPERLLLLAGLNTVSAGDMIKRFADAYGTPNLVASDGLDNEADKAGEWMADGHYTQSAYDLERTNYILSFGASILESYKPLARSLRMWGKIRGERPNRAKVVVIDPRYSVTALRSDEWVPVNPGTDGALALALAHVIIDEGLYDADFTNNWTSGFDEYKKLVLEYYDPATVSGITGIPADTIRRIAREFATTKPAIAWRGRGATGWPNGSYTSHAVFCLNALVGSIDVPGGVIYQEDPSYRAMPALSEDDTSAKGKARPRLDLSKSSNFPAAATVTNQVADSIPKKDPYPVEIAMGFNGNFNMSAPGAGRWDGALEKVPYYVHAAPFISEMAEYADIFLPLTTYMEEWAYDHSPPGSGFAEFRIKQPVVEPLYNAKNSVDIIFEIAGRIRGAVGQSFTGIGDNAEGFVKFRTADLAPWDRLLDEGVWVGPDYEYYKYDRIFNTPSGKFEFNSGNLVALLREQGEEIDSLTGLPYYREVEYLGDRAKYPLLLSTYQPLLDVENGSQNYPWAQEMYLVMHGAGWTNFAEMNSRTAQGLKIKHGDMVWVESPYGKIRVKARVFEGIHPGVVSIALGQGHRAEGEWSRGIGVNPNEIIGVDYDRLSGQSALFNTRVRVYKA
ncbi:MAG: molybdopterin-dependent oxidoreductase [Dehalococcoidales bacterium]|nr:molybdopterin-dependent oxidoreductase [Dehalococcoidales bacterium]